MSRFGRVDASIFVPSLLQELGLFMTKIGLKHTSELTVTDAVTAIKVGSGDMPVLATPMMMALMENAAMLLGEGTHLRFIVDKEKFLRSVGSKRP